MGINTLRVGPLLCPDNVGMLIFARYFLDFCRVQLFLSFFYFLRLSIGLTPQNIYFALDLHPRQSKRGFQVSARSTEVTWLTLLNIPKS